MINIDRDLVLFGAYQHASGVSGQTLLAGKSRDVLRRVCECSGRVVSLLHLLDKIID